MISSKRLTEFRGFPMPSEWPEYPSHRLALSYLEDYADQFDLHRHIEYRTGVERAQREPGHGWRVRLEGGATRTFEALVVANGHNRDPRYPDWAGRFAGDELHAAHYRTPDVLQDRRVLIVGAGNSGCDIAAESAQHARRTVLSMRRGYHFLPKFWRGQPIDQVGERLLRFRAPLAVRRRLARLGAYLTLGDQRAVGVPEPDHRLFETHPVINSQLIYHAQHGDVTIKPGVRGVEGSRVEFVDGDSQEFDLVVYATGYHLSIPFLDRGEMHWRGERLGLYLNLFSPTHDDVFFAGLIQPDSGQWGIGDLQAELVTRYLIGLREARPAALRLQARVRRGVDDYDAKINYVGSPRHALEVEHYSYRRRLEKEVARLKR